MCSRVSGWISDRVSLCLRNEPAIRRVFYYRDERLFTHISRQCRERCIYPQGVIGVREALINY